MKGRVKKIGLVDTLFSPFVDARGTMENLLVVQKRPPYLLVSLFLFTLLFLAPPFMYEPGVGLRNIDLQPFLPILQASYITLTLTTCFVAMLLNAIGVPQPILVVFGALVYATTPFISFMTIVYVANYFLAGQLTILFFLMSGHTDPTDWLVVQFPLLFKVCCLISFWVFSNAMRVVTRGSVTSAILMAAMCIPFLLGSFALSVYVTEINFPGSAPRVLSFFTSFVGAKALF